MAEQAPFYIFTAFVFSYGIGTLHVSRDLLLTAVLAASVLSFVSIPVFGHLSDQIGPSITDGAATGIFGFIYFAMLNTGSVPIFLAIILSCSARHAVRSAKSPIARAPDGCATAARRLPAASVIAAVRRAARRGCRAIGAAMRYIAICAVITLIAIAHDRLHRQGHQCRGCTSGRFEPVMKQMMKWRNESALDFTTSPCDLPCRTWLFAHTNPTAALDLRIAVASRSCHWLRSSRFRLGGMGQSAGRMLADRLARSACTPAR